MDGIVAVRGGRETMGAGKLHGGNRRCKRVFKQPGFLRGEPAEHVPGEVLSVGPADPDLQARKILGAEVLENRADSVVPARPALFAKPQAAERQRDVVVDHQHFGSRPLVERGHLAHAAAAVIHERLRLEQHRAVPQPRHVTLPFRARRELRALGGGQAVEDHEPDIVAGPFVLPPRISEADDERKRGHPRSLSARGQTSMPVSPATTDFRWESAPGPKDRRPGFEDPAAGDSGPRAASPGKRRSQARAW